MERIEPTIGKIDLQPTGGKEVPSILQRSGNVQKALTDWFIIALLSAVVIALFYWVTLKTGLLPDQFQIGTPKLFERILILVGLTTTLGSQVIGSILLFRFSFERGALALLLPGYLPIALKRSGIFWAVMGPWCLGILLVVAATILLN
jgi:hypothetical protein